MEPMESGQQEAMVGRRRVGGWETLMGCRQTLGDGGETLRAVAAKS